MRVTEELETAPCLDCVWNDKCHVACTCLRMWAIDQEFDDYARTPPPTAATGDKFSLGDRFVLYGGWQVIRENAAPVIELMQVPQQVQLPRLICMCIQPRTGEIRCGVFSFSLKQVYDLLTTILTKCFSIACPALTGYFLLTLLMYVKEWYAV